MSVRLYTPFIDVPCTVYGLLYSSTFSHGQRGTIITRVIACTLRPHVVMFSLSKYHLCVFTWKHNDEGAVFWSDQNMCDVTLQNSHFPYMVCTVSVVEMLV